MYGKEYLEEMEARKCYAEMIAAIDEIENRYDAAAVVLARRLVGGHFPRQVVPMSDRAPHLANQLANQHQSLQTLGAQQSSFGVMGGVLGHFAG